MTKKNTWMYISFSALFLSVVSLFLPIITYKNSNGKTYSYNVFRLFRGSDFIRNVLSDDNGAFMRNGKNPILKYFTSLTAEDFLPSFLTILITAVAVLAIVISIIGIFSMSKQYESNWPFTLTLIGLIGTAIPAVVLLIIYLISKKYFNEAISVGAYVFITPLAMIAAIITVTNRHRLSLQERRIQEEARRYLIPAGDLPVGQNQKGYHHGQQY